MFGVGWPNESSSRISCRDNAILKWKPVAKEALVTEPGAVATGSYTQPAIDDFAAERPVGYG